MRESVNAGGWTASGKAKMSVTGGTAGSANVTGIMGGGQTVHVARTGAMWDAWLADQLPEPGHMPAVRAPFEVVAAPQSTGRYYGTHAAVVVRTGELAAYAKAGVSVSKASKAERKWSEATRVSRIGKAVAQVQAGKITEQMAMVILGQHRDHVSVDVWDGAIDAIDAAVMERDAHVQDCNSVA